MDETRTSQMRTMSLRARLASRVWDEIWPDADTPVAVTDQPTVDTRLGSQAWRCARVLFSTTSVAPNIASDGPSVSLAEAHEFLDHLDAWIQQHRRQLTWPPTAQALIHVLRSDPESYGAVIVKTMLASAWPDVINGLADAVYNRTDAGLGRPTNKLSDNLEEPPANDTAKTSRSSERRAQKARRQAFYQDITADPDVTALRNRLEKTAHALPADRGLAMEVVDAEIKAAMKSRRPFRNRAEGTESRFVSWLLPALASMQSDLLAQLLTTWPPQHRVSADPERLFNNFRFWTIMNGSENKKLLMKQLPTLIDSDDWTFQQRHHLLPLLFKYSGKRQELFDASLDLWTRLGGRLDQTVTLCAPSSSATNAHVDEDNLFDTPAATKTTVSARSWLSEQFPDRQLPPCPASKPDRKPRQPW